jgi:Cys-tRNA(Pro)/Cys-tRNA(Cys) deacylase
LSGTPATLALRTAGITFVEHAYRHDPAVTDYGREAAIELGVDADRIFKTLIADVDGQLVVGIVPVSARLDLKALATAAGGKRADLADPSLAQRKTGYVLGGISPIGQKTRLPTILDETALLWDTVFVSGGRRGLDLELSPDDLIRTTDATVADIATD